MDNNLDTNVEVNNKEKGNKSWLMSLIFLIIGLAVGVTFSSYINSYGTSKSDKKEPAVKEDAKLEVTSEVKDKLNLFINAASSGYGDRGKYMKTFVDGKDSFADSEKYLIVYNALYYKNFVTKDVVLSEQEIGSLKDGKMVEYFKTYKDTALDTAKTEIFDSVYNYLFNTNDTKTYSNPSSELCPLQIGVNDEYGNIYFGKECGGIGGFTYEQSIKSIDIDGDNYLVHQEGTFISVPGGEEEVKLLWTFDKDLNFVSTVKE